MWRNLCMSLYYFVLRVRSRRKESSRLLSYLLMSFLSRPLNRGVYTRGGMVRDAPWRKLGGKCCDDNDAFARVYNNLLLHEYIYYFTLVHF